ncbi:prolyl oligopeptidase family serine peptidase [Streptacidiphilus sp. N1-10]|uniref:Prolyl oligopeptidase family serine peptidase n=1 Tax=Streptacidiphilus jeojiensis TaxID=3229225 RepID=A0ABV6XPG3_9ACTN
MADEDPYLWLEDVTGERALDWVRARNEESTGRYATGPAFDALREDLRAVLDAEGRIPYVTRRGEYLYNFWQDAEHPRGLWRRTTLEQYRTDAPAWEVVLDVDALARDEDENWVWHGADVLRPGHRLALVELSRGGADAAVVREFDIEERRFVKDGFELPEAKSRVGWIDADRVYLGTDFGEGSLTESGYPRLVKEWRRGTPPDQAVTVFEGRTEDVSVSAHHDPTPGFERDFVHRGIDFFRDELFLRPSDGSELVRVEVPEDAEASVHREWLLVRTRSPWRTGGRDHPTGALLAIGFEEFMAGGRGFTTVFEPDGRTSLEDYRWTRNHLLLTVLRDVATELRVLTPAGEGPWASEPLPGTPPLGSAGILDTNPEDDDEFLTLTTGFTTPPTLSRGVVGGPVEVLKRAPDLFDAEGTAVEQHFAVSEDGTRIPYFVVRPRPGGGADGADGEEGGRTLLTGYGGFEVSLTPDYLTVVGRGWLERGGTYVLANIRGGGEYGPEWHTQAVKAGRHKVYEDFAAVARDLVRRGVTTPAELVIQGGSNGGLLMGVMLTRYPELFAAIACQVPLLDMKRYHKLLAGASWTAEYGDPDDPEQWAYIGAYSPYQNIREQPGYPPVLFATSTRDDRVHPGHARKMAARMLELGHTVDYYENTEGGHGGASNNEQTAFKWALVLDYLWTHAGT